MVWQKLYWINSPFQKDELAVLLVSESKAFKRARSSAAPEKKVWKEKQERKILLVAMWNSITLETDTFLPLTCKLEALDLILDFPFWIPYCLLPKKKKKKENNNNKKTQVNKPNPSLKIKLNAVGTQGPHNSSTAIKIFFLIFVCYHPFPHVITKQALNY